MAEAQPSSADLSPLKRALLALDKMQARLDALEGEKREPIAILGMGCRFPGGVETADAFWNLLAEGRDAVGRYPETRPGAESWRDAAPDAATDELIRHGGYLSDVAGFDPGFFGISPREAMRMDPQQRMLLQTACEALESAGLPLEKLAGTKTGVFVGIHSQSNDYYHLQVASPEDMDTYTSTGTAHSIVANRLSYALDLRGPSMAVDTACSSSLVALHLACQSLRLRESAVALAGGVNLILSPEASLAFTRLEFLAPDGRCKTFDSSANGFVRAEGCGMIVLKRLADALRDGDPVLAVIRGTAINQDGTTNGLTAPNGLSQQAVIRAALENGRVDPKLVTLLETHGTGTPLGDPIEVDALRGAYPPNIRRALGAVKTNIGHAEAAAGIAGVMKVVLALQHRTIPRNLHFKQINPHIRLEGSQFYIPVENTPWEGDAHTRHASVSSFGFGGTNAHIVLQEAPAPSLVPTARSGEGPSSPCIQIVPLSARAEPALKASLARWREHLEGCGRATALADIAHTAALRRSHHPVRAAMLARSTDDLREKLDQLTRGEQPAGAFRGAASPERPRVAFVFCGQGPQWWAMGRELLESEAVFRSAVEQCASEMARHVRWNLLEELTRTEATSRLQETELAQPALFALQLGLAAIWRSWGIEPQALAGHSVGEVAAAHLGGALSLADAVRVICTRGRIMQAATGLGRMAAIELSEAEVAHLLQPHRQTATIAALNSPTSTVISGAANAVEAVCAAARDRGARVKVLPVNYAFHSPQMEPFRDEMTAAVAGIQLQALTTPVYSTVLGGAAGPAEFTAAYWGANIRQPVRFAPAVAAMLTDGIDCFIEIGPQPVLGSMIAQCAEAAKRKCCVVPSLRPRQPEREVLLESLAELYVRGASPQWSAVAPAGGRPVTLPAYPWNNRQLWLDAPAGRPAGARAHGSTSVRHSGPELRRGRRLRSPALAATVFELPLDLSSPRFVADHRILGSAVVPAPLLLEMVLGAAADLFPHAQARLSKVAFLRPLVLGPNAGRLVHLVLDRADGHHPTFTIHSCVHPSEGEPTWTEHATGQIDLDSSRGDESNGAALHSPDSGWAGLAAEVPPDEFYGDFLRRGADFGPSFRVIRRLACRPGEALAEIERPRDPATSDPGYFLHPVLWDAALQIVAASRPVEEGAPADALYMFCGFDSLRICGTPTTRLVCRASSDAASGAAGRALTGRVRIETPAGELVASIEGARFQRTSRELLQAYAGSQEARLIHEVVWRPRHNTRVSLARTTRSPVPALESAHSAVAAFLAAQTAPTHQAGVVEAFDRQAVRYVQQALVQLGWTAQERALFSAEQVRQDLHLAPQHARLLARMFDMLGAEGLLEPAGDHWRPRAEFLQDHRPSPLGEIVARFPEHRAEAVLFDRCASRLADVLRGRCDPLQLLFPEGSIESATQVYQDAPMSRLPNAATRALVAHVAERAGKGHVLRILEIGAGTGGTTSHLLPVLDGIRCEYVFSDLSPLFLQRARERFAAHAFLRFELLDIERPPVEQGFAPAQFDLIIAANVIHATRDLEVTMGHVRDLLAPGGCVALLEGHRPSRWIDLVFGQTEGWWRFADLERRPAHPLMSIDRWCTLLRGVGFENSVGLPASFPGETTLFDQALILAQVPAEPSRRPAPAHVEPSAWTVVAPGPEDARLVVSEISARGNRVEFVPLPEDADQSVTAIGAVDRPLDHLLFVWSGVPEEKSTDSTDVFKAATRMLTQALRAAQALASRAQTRRPRLWFITRGTQPVEGATVHPEAAVLWGLGQVVSVEHPEIWGGVADLGGPASDPDDVRALVDHIEQFDGEDRCAIRSGIRFVPRLIQSADTAPAAAGWRNDASYVVTGGLGGLGLQIAQWLAAEGVRRIILLGRTELPARDRWDALPPDTVTGRRIQAIRDIEKAGASVRTMAADVADATSVRSALDDLRKRDWLPVAGVIHAAAAIDDRLVNQLDTEGFAVTLRPKLLGASVLVRELADQPLDFFVCCSSLGSILGQAGQANYAAANAFLDAFAHAQPASRTRYRSINWGGWYGTGFALTDGGKRTIASLEQRGILGFTPEEGVAALGSLLRRDEVQAAVFRVDPDRFRKAFPPGEEPPLLRELLRQMPSAVPVQASLPAEPAASTHSVREQLLAVESGDKRRGLLQEHLIRLIASVLKLEPAAVDVEQPLGSLGLDSLMGFELKNRCERTFGLTLSATMVWNYPTVALLCAFLAEKMGIALDDAVVTEHAETSIAQPATSQLDDISDEQALNSLLNSRPTPDSRP